MPPVALSFLFAFGWVMPELALELFRRLHVGRWGQYTVFALPQRVAQQRRQRRRGAQGFVAAHPVARGVAVGVAVAVSVLDEQTLAVRQGDMLIVISVEPLDGVEIGHADARVGSGHD